MKKLMTCSIEIKKALPEFLTNKQRGEFGNAIRDLANEEDVALIHSVNPRDKFHLAMNSRTKDVVCGFLFQDKLDKPELWKWYRAGSRTYDEIKKQENISTETYYPPAIINLVSKSLDFIEAFLLRGEK